MRETRLRRMLCGIAAALATLAIGAPCSAAAPVRLDIRAENRTILIPGPGDGTFQVQVIVPDLPYPDDRPKLNLALVIDRSGSMADANKLEYVKTAAHRLIDLMGNDDILSIVAYDHQVRVAFPARRVDGNREALHRIVADLYPGGRTFLSGGLEEGFRQARSARRGGYVNRVLLLSDGLANVGVTSRNALRDRASTMAEYGISVSTFGVGNQFDEELLAMVASGGGGGYRYLGDPEQIAAALSSEFRTASRTAACDVEIVIRFRPDCRFRWVLGREWRRDGDAYVIRLGDLSAGERRTLFASLSVSGTKPEVREVADVALRYRDPVTGKTVAAAPLPVSLELVRDEARYREGFDRSVQERKAVAESGALVQEAARLADQGKKEQAKELLGKAAAGLAAAPASPAVRAEMERADAYRKQLDSLTDMASDEAKGAQKAVKYRSYEILDRQ
ncbi:MAG: vWA domain-containing protein [Verrucomicrobiota bacterium]